MEIPPDPPQVSTGEKVARWGVLAFLGLALLTLAFGLGFGLKELTDDNSKPAASQPSNSNGNSNDNAGVGAAVIDEIVNILKTQYVDRNTLDPEALKDAAIHGIIQSLNDRETNYISPTDLKSGALQLQSTYEGIGASVTDRNGSIQIVAPFRDSPAEKAGIKAGDIILAVDGEPTDGWTDTHAVEVIRGPRGTAVELKIQHADQSVETLKITRGDIDIESVFTEPNLEAIPGESGKDLVDRTGAKVTDIGYVSISQFHDKTVDELVAKMKDAESKGWKGLIVDLRSNPGGGLQATIEVADEFLDQGTIITEVDANGKESSTSATRGGILTDLPLVVLQDGGSASGAEVLAAALRDNGRATIIGTQSFGKGTVNRLVPLQNCGEPQCGAVYLSIGRWETPKGEIIEGVGITPDIELPMTSDQYIEQGDIQLFKAIDVLRGSP